MALCRIFPNHDIRRIRCCSSLNAFLGSPDTLTGTPASYLPRFHAVEMDYGHRNAYRRLKTELIIYRLFLTSGQMLSFWRLGAVLASGIWQMLGAASKSPRTRCTSTVFASLSNHCSSADEMVLFRDSFAFNFSLWSLPLSENIARPFLRISSAFGTMGGGGGGNVGLFAFELLSGPGSASQWISNTSEFYTSTI